MTTCCTLRVHHNPQPLHQQTAFMGLVPVPDYTVSQMKTTICNQRCGVIARVNPRSTQWQEFTWRAFFSELQRSL